MNQSTKLKVILEENGFIFIDRDYNRFERILRFMRKPVGASLPGDLYGLRELLVEAKHFGFEVGQSIDLGARVAFFAGAHCCMPDQDRHA